MSKLNIVVLSGGRGSLALQSGVRKFYRELGVDHSIATIVNAYDDGKSTGLVRKLVPGGMLGPSDVRKLQFAQYAAIGGDGQVLNFFEHRFESHSNETERFLRGLALGTSPDDRLGGVFRELPANVRRLVSEAMTSVVSLPGFDKLQFTDFSLANLIYGGLAALNGNDLQAVEAIIRRELGLPDPVILNSTENFYLCGLTEGGHFLSEEAQIVDYRGRSPIYEVFLSREPISEKISDEFSGLTSFQMKKDFMRGRFPEFPRLSILAAHAIADADIILYAPGTQHSSLYPTYFTRGLADALCRSRALKVMVTNILHDNEIPDFRASDIIRQALFYLNEKGGLEFDPMNLVDSVIVNDPLESKSLYIRPNRTELERIGIKDVRCEKGLEASGDDCRGRHDPERLAQQIDQAYRDGVSHIGSAQSALVDGVIAFDLDDTLFLDRRQLLVRGLKGSALNVDQTNLNLIWELLEKGFRLVVLSGNDYEVIKNNFVKELLAMTGVSSHVLENLTIYANGSTTKYVFNSPSGFFELDRSYSDKYCVKPEDRALIGRILDEALASLRDRYPTMVEVFEHYDPKLFGYDALPERHRVRGDYSQMVIKPVPSDRHSYAGREPRNDRQAVVSWIRERLAENRLDGAYSVLLRGWGTIEIQDKRVDKFCALQDYLAGKRDSASDVVYFGNEFDPTDGNDFPIAQKGICVIAVSRNEATLPKLKNVVYGGHRGTASTSFHLEHLLEIYEHEMERARIGQGEVSTPATCLYINKLLKEKLAGETARIGADVRLENQYLQEALQQLYQLLRRP